jgi:hypothetical protein
VCCWLSGQSGEDGFPFTNLESARSATKLEQGFDSPRPTMLSDEINELLLDGVSAHVIGKNSLRHMNGLLPRFASLDKTLRVSLTP